MKRTIGSGHKAKKKRKEGREEGKEGKREGGEGVKRKNSSGVI